VRRRILFIDLALAFVEVVAVTLGLYAFYQLDPVKAFPGAVILGGPVLGALLYGLIFSSRRLDAIVGSHADAEAREWIVVFPRRTLINRTLATLGLCAVIAPTVGYFAAIPANLVIAVIGLVSSMTFSANVIRAFLFRRVLTPRALELFADDPKRYYARTLRERLFVAGNFFGVVGGAASWAFLLYFTGIPLQQVARIWTFVPPLTGALAIAWSIDLFFRTRPLLAFLTNAESGSARHALRAITPLPYQLALSLFGTWIVAGGFFGFDFMLRGNLPADAAQIWAAISAVALGNMLYLFSINRRIVEPIRELAAEELARRGEAPERSWLTLRIKLGAAFLLLILFGGTFAFLTAYAEHERYLASTAANDAAAERDFVWTGRDFDVVQAAEEGEKAVETLLRSLPQTKGEPFVTVDDRAFVLHMAVLAEAGRLRFTTRSNAKNGEPKLESRYLSDAATTSLSPIKTEGTAPLGDLRASMAWRRASPHVCFGIITTWRQRDRGIFGLSSLLFVFGTLALATLGVVFLTVAELTRPVRSLARSASRIGRGELDEPVVAPDSDELGALATSLENARRELRSKLESIAELNASLEEKVRERTRELEEVNASLSKALRSLAEAQEQVVQSEKMASVGRLVAGIAHEINNPLNFIQNSQAPLRARIGDLKAVLDAAKAPPHASVAELRKVAQRVRGVLSELDVEERVAELDQLMKVMENGVSRMVTVVRALRDFSRHGTGGEAESVDLNGAVDSAVALLRHDLHDRVDVVKQVEQAPKVWAQPGPFGQVMVNLLKNAAQAIEGKGEIRVESHRQNGGVEVAIRDNGAGMPPDVVSKIFEPFFTTKQQGEGTGLGLAIVHGIVEKHGGRISVQSDVGKGTEFRMFFPDSGAHASKAPSPSGRGSG
jgi:signal transduction histidine kinase